MSTIVTSLASMKGLLAVRDQGREVLGGGNDGQSSYQCMVCS